MSVKVIKNKVFDGIRTYEVGDVIEGLSENDKSQLVSEGIVEYVGIRSEIKKYRLVNNYKKEIDSLVGNIGKDDNLKVDTETVPIDEVNHSEDEKASPESEENLIELIDPNTFALNPNEYIKDPSPKGKKGKVV